jgi:hypothetical protein
MLVLLVVSSCRKPSVPINCEKLSNGLATDNKEDVGAMVNEFIHRLPSIAYTDGNLAKLVQSISKSCSVGAETFCFDCIKTLPSQSEIRLTYSSATSQGYRIIGISYDTNNQMKFVGMHQ